MNSIAHPRRIDLDRIAAAFPARRVATIITTILLMVIMVSFRPFQPESLAVDGGGGDIVNQLGFGSLGAISLVSLLTLADRRISRVLISPWWLLIAGFVVIAVLIALDPNSAMRAAIFTLIGIITIGTVLVLPRDADSLASALFVSGLTVVLISYAGVLLYPSVAIHSGDSLEFQHAGLWRGAFSHKNVAGPVMACLSFAGLYIFRRGQRVQGAILFGLAMVFMLNTGSKTTAGLVPVSIILVALPGIIGLRGLTPVVFLATMIGATIGTLGIVFIEPVKELAQHLAPDLTYTGRTALWSASGEVIARHPWIGYGFESFWGSPYVAAVDKAFDQDWDIRGAVHAHNGYLDIAITMGLPGLAAFIVVFWIVPVIDYVRTPRLKENVYLSDLFMMMLMFTSLNALLESFFLRRADPVWLFFAMGALGLRVFSRIPMRSSTA